MDRHLITKNLFRGTMLVLMMAELSGAASSAVDGILTGRFLGSEAMSACGLASPYYPFVTIFSGLIAVGCQSLCVAELSRGNRKRASNVFSLCALLAFAIGIAIVLAGELFARPVAVLFGARGEAEALAEGAASYLRGLVLGTPFMILFVLLTPVLQLDGDGKLVTAASLTMAGADALADLLNVLVFRGGLFGMGAATSVSQVAACAVMLLHFRKKDRMFHFDLSELLWKELPGILREGMPRAVTMLARMAAPILLNTVILSVAAEAGLLAISVQRSLSFLVGTAGWGIAGATLMLSSMYYAEKNRQELAATLRTMAGRILLWILPISLAMALAAPLLVSLYLPDAGANRGAAVSAIRWFAVSLPITALNMSLANYLQSIGKNLFAQILNACIEAFGMLACAAVLGPAMGLVGIWVAFPAGQMLILLAVLLYALLLSRRNAAKDGWLLLPDSFGNREEDVFSGTADDEASVVELSSAVAKACAERGIDRRRTYLVPLFVEELAGNVVEHGFSDGKAHHLELHVIFEGEDVAITLRDDCRGFDITRKIRDWELDPEHPEKNMGIRLVMGLAKDVGYTNTLNVNHLSVHL